jgi:uncharacterized protein
MFAHTPTMHPGPLAASERVTNLDAIRGLSVLGILLMNAVSFGLVPAAYFNLSAGGSRSWLDKAIGAAGEVFVDQKTMGLFSMLFGAGIVLFADRAAAKTAHPVRLVLWRNALLLLIGFLHSLIWEGDVLMVYAVCAPLLVWMRHVRPRRLLVVGSSLVLWSGVLAAIVQTRVPNDGAGLGDYWLTDGSPMSDAVGLFLLNDFFARSLGMMLIGIALYRLEILQGARPAEFYRRLATWGLGIGLPIAIAGLLIQVAFDFDPRIALIGEAPNTIATIPIALGYLGLITLWNRRPATSAHLRVRAAGRMALTNYLTQTLLGIFVLRSITDPDTLGRSGIVVFVVIVWAVQLAWSKPWLDHFRFGPAEWLWRSATYRRLEPFRRSTAARHPS